MHDPVEINRHMERVIDRVSRRSDYATLLHAGEVIARIEDIGDPISWRAQLKREARADRIKVRTGEGEGRVWAMLRNPATDQRLSEVKNYLHVLNDGHEKAIQHGHLPVVVARDAAEAVLGCKRCEVFGYLDGAEQSIMAGPLFEDACAGSVY